MARLPKRPTISPAFPPFPDEGRYGRGTILEARRVVGQQRFRQCSAARPDNSVADEPRQKSFLFVPAARDPFEARDRTSAVDDENLRTAFEPVDQGAEAILGFADANFFHVAMIAYSQSSHAAAENARFVTMTTRFIGDVHGKFRQYKRIIEGCQNSVQLGDMYVGLRRWPHGEPSADPPYDLMVAGGHRFIRGNHDNPAVCRQHSQCIPDGTIENGIMFIGGGLSIDKEIRTEDYSWWPDEELSIAELNKLVKKYQAAKPRIMVTHDCPEEVASILLIDRTRLDLPSRTRLAFQTMWSAHSPEIWLFGHHHVSFDHILHGGRGTGTRFICLAELEHRDVDIGDVVG
jgi:Calcineurin-like phosphoesterase